MLLWLEVTPVYFVQPQSSCSETRPTTSLQSIGQFLRECPAEVTLGVSLMVRGGLMAWVSHHATPGRGHQMHPCAEG